MSSTATSRSGVDDLGPDALLAAVRNNERDPRRQADLHQLHLAYQWCVLHPATADTGVAVWGGDGDLDADESLGGDGTPMVAAFAPEPFGLALGVSTDTAKTLLADALDLVHRLPHTWRRLQTLEVPVWRGRRLAQKTHALNVKAAAHVDRLLAPRLHTVGVTRLDRASPTPSRSTCPRSTRPGRTRPADLGRDPAPPDPDRVRRHQRAPRHRRHDDAHQPLRPDLRRRRRPQDRRRRRPARASARPKPSAPSPAHRRPSSTCTSTPLTGRPPVGRVENLGPATTDKIRAWLGDTRATIQPVLRMDRTDAVDAHDPPPGCATWSSFATPPASSPTASATPAPATSTTSCPYDEPDRPARPVQPTSHRCADDTTEPRPAAAGDTNASPTAPTAGTDPTTRPTSSPTAAPNDCPDRRDLGAPLRVRPT